MHPLPLSLEQTFATLVRSRSASVAGVLRRAAQSNDAAIRQRAVATLLVRNDERCHQIIGELWPDWDREIVEVVLAISLRRTLASWYRTLRQKISRVGTIHDDTMPWVEIAQRTNAWESIESLIDLAESAVDVQVCSTAVDATTQLCQSWSRALHGNDRSCPFERDREPLRETIIKRCFQLSSRPHPALHEGSQPIATRYLDNAISISRWSDPWVCFDSTDTPTPLQTLIADRWFSSPTEGVMRMLANAICQPTISEEAWIAIKTRTDLPFRDMLLQMISPSPSQFVLSHLSNRGLPESLWREERPESNIQTLSPVHRIASLHAISAARSDQLQTIDTILDAADDEDESIQSAVACSLSRCVPPTVNVWIDATSGSQSRRVVLARRILDRLLDITHRVESAVTRAAHRLLRSLDSRHVVPLMANLSPAHRCTLGLALMHHDPLTVDVVRDGLRHPLMRRRLEAIDLVDTLSLVDVLIQPLKHIATHDHQIARIRVAEALARAEDPFSLEVLQEMTGALQVSVAEAAKAAIQTRKSGELVR